MVNHPVLGQTYMFYEDSDAILVTVKEVDSDSIVVAYLGGNNSYGFEIDETFTIYDYEYDQLEELGPSTSSSISTSQAVSNFPETDLSVLNNLSEVNILLLLTD